MAATSVLNQIAYFQDRRDEVPNQLLAKELAAKKNKKGVAEIADNLWSDNANIQSDCLKVLYEVGYLSPALIADYVDDFLKLLEHKNNRLVWGAMIALSTIADLRPDEIYKQLSVVRTAMESGTVITMDNGVKVLALVAASGEARSKKVFPYLLTHLATCRSKEIPQHSEKTLPAVNAKNKAEFITVLEKRMKELPPSQLARVKKVIREAEKR